VTPEAQAIAELRAAQDRDTLARLRREGKVILQPAYTGESRPFVKDIERRAFGDRRARGMDTIRPKNKKRRRG
jgi:hypothetical protein